MLTESWDTKPRRAVASCLALVALASFLNAGCGIAAVPGKPTTPAVAQIGLLDLDVGGATSQPIDALRKGLRELGLVEGKNLTIEYRFAEGREDRLPALATELTSLPLSVIVSTTTQATRAVEQTGTSTPIVFTGLQDPVGSGLVDSLARPGHSATGTTMMTPQLHAKRLELLEKAIPDLVRVAVFANPSSVGTQFDEIGASAKPRRLTIDAYPVHLTSEFQSAFDAARESGDRAVMVLPDALFFNNRPEMIALGVSHKLPEMYWTREFADEGAMMAYGSNRPEAFRRAASYIDKILKGAKPADLPVEQPVQFDFVINMKRTAALGITIPRDLMVQATDLVQ